MNALTRALPWLSGIAAVLILPHVFSSGASISIMSLIGFGIIFALSYNILLGQTGMLSFGHAVYYGLGGFITAHALNIIAGSKLPIPLPLVPLIGGIAGLVFAAPLGWVSTKRAGTAFSMISLGVGELVAACALILRGFFGGEGGISTSRTSVLQVFGWSFGPQIQVYYLIYAWCLICAGLMYAFTQTPLGRICNAVRDNPERTEFVGYSTHMVRFLAFCIAGFFAGVAGGLAAIHYEIVTSGVVGAGPSGFVLLMTFIGGTGFFIGPVLGAILMSAMQSLSDITGAWLLYLGILFILMVMFAPGGLAGLLFMHRPAANLHGLAKLAPAYLVAAIPGLGLFAGIVFLIETSHHVLVKSSEGMQMRLLGLEYQADAPLTWALIAALIVVTFLAFRRTWPWVASAWSEAIKPEAR
ncbi:MAG: branched-chain amino acid ABC transporter permease [Betaproteobacteria bacterium]|jgi:branched-chain amino acid transport system permease protein|nr:branched-chain amino acid ABC transporter permease [Betaproteobacteria bacterium]